MKASPVRSRDYLEFFAEVKLLGASLLAEEVVVVVNIPVTYLLVIHYDRSTTAARMTN